MFDQNSFRHPNMFLGSSGSQVQFGPYSPLYSLNGFSEMGFFAQIRLWRCL